MLASASEDLQSITISLKVWIIAMTLWFIFDELFELKRYSCSVAEPEYGRHGTI